MRDFYVRPFTVNINPFLINVPLLYPLKTKAKAENIFSKKQFFCEVFSISMGKLISMFGEIGQSIQEWTG